jgi:hypothetical protein
LLRSKADMTDTEACIALNLIPNLGPVRVRKLLQAFGNPASSLFRQADEKSRELKDSASICPSISQSGNGKRIWRVN